MIWKAGLVILWGPVETGVLGLVPGRVGIGFPLCGGDLDFFELEAMVKEDEKT